jgi:hypothetical protein
VLVQLGFPKTNIIFLRKIGQGQEGLYPKPFLVSRCTAVLKKRRYENHDFLELSLDPVSNPKTIRFVSTNLNKGYVTLWPCHLHFKVS